MLRCNPPTASASSGTRSRRRSRSASSRGRTRVGLFADSVANVYDLNYLRAAEPAPAVVLADEAEQAMETFLHRKVVVERRRA